MEKITTPGIMSLEDALQEKPTFGRNMKVFLGVNTGFRTVTTNLSLFELQEFTEVANEQNKSDTNVAQRKLDPEHATAIAKYVLKGLLSAARRKKNMQGQPISMKFEEVQKNIGVQPYLSIPPLVASLRNYNPNGTNLSVMPLLTLGSETASYRLFLKPSDILWIIDGQHRRMGIGMVSEFLKYVKTNHKYPGRGSLYTGGTKDSLLSDELSVWDSCFEMLRESEVAVEIHPGLTIDQERQLFHDLNNLSKKVEKSLALEYDGSNPVNSFIGVDLISTLFPDYQYPVISEKAKKEGFNKGLTRQDLVAINALLFLNKTNITGATPANTEPKVDIARSFWEMILNLKSFTDEDSKIQTVLGHPVVLKAIAKLTYDFNFGKIADWVTPENAEALVTGIQAFDFSHTNQIWRYYQFNQNERETLFPGLAAYLPSEEEGQNRSIGTFVESTKQFSFENRHNDIFPIIGDMIRWRIGLPNRRGVR